MIRKGETNNSKVKAKSKLVVNLPKLLVVTFIFSFFILNLVGAIPQDRTEPGISWNYPEEPINYSNKSVNFSQHAEEWITNDGNLDNIDTSQFNNNAGTLEAVKSWWDNLYCELTGCDMEGDLNMGNNSIIWINHTDFTPIPEGEEPTAEQGRIFYSSERETFCYYDADDNRICLGSDLITNAKNTEGSTIYRGDAVYIDSSTGENPTVKLAQASTLGEARVFGLVQKSSISNNAVGKIIINGRLNNVDTSSWTAGDTLYVSPTTAGELTNIKPTQPDKSFRVGTVIRSDASDGSILVDNDRELDNFNSGSVIFANGNGELAQDTNLTYNHTTDTFSVDGNVSADYFLGDGSQLTNVNYTETDPIWSSDKGDYYNKTEVNDSYLAIDGSNANSNIDIGSYDYQGFGTFSSGRDTGLIYGDGVIYAWSDGTYTSTPPGSDLDLGTSNMGIFNDGYFKGSLYAGNLTLSSGSITDSSGTIDFEDENLTTTGKITGEQITSTDDINASDSIIANIGLIIGTTKDATKVVNVQGDTEQDVFMKSGAGEYTSDLFGEGGMGGVYTLEAGDGGLATGDIITFGGKGGTFTLRSGSGGKSNGTGDNIGGKGGIQTILGGSGGDALNGTSNIGGDGGDVTIAGGPGGDGVDTSGVGGDVNINGGLGGDSGTGASGNIYIGNRGDVRIGSYTAPTSKLSVTGGIDITGYMYWGAGQDASIFYDGTDMIINPKDVGSGGLDIQGNIAIGNGATPTSSQILNVGEDVTRTTNTWGLLAQLDWDGSSDNTGTLFGASSNIRANVDGGGTGDLNEIRSNQAIASFKWENAGDASTVSNYYALMNNDADYTGTITDWALYNAEVSDIGGTITNLYGLKLPDITYGANNYAIKTGSGLIDFGDDVQIAGNVDINSGDLSHEGNTGLTGNYSVGNCWQSYSGGIMYDTNCTSI